MDRRHTSIRGRRLMLSGQSMRSTPRRPPPCGFGQHPAPNPMTLLVVEEQVGNTRAIHLHMFQLPKNWMTRVRA